MATILTSYLGINAFGHVAALKDVVVAGSGGNGGNEYIVAPLKTTLNNPSNVTLHSVDVALPVYYNNVMIGRAAIDVHYSLSILECG